MFLIGKGFALYVFVDRRDRRGDIWYVSLDSKGIIRTHTLKYIYSENIKEVLKSSVRWFVETN